MKIPTATELNPPEDPSGLSYKVRKGLPIPPPSGVGSRGPLTVAMSELAVGECIEFDSPMSVTFRSDLYLRAKTAKIKIAVRTVHENGTQLLRLWRIK